MPVTYMLKISSKLINVAMNYKWSKNDENRSSSRLSAYN